MKPKFRSMLAGVACLAAAVVVLVPSLQGGAAARESQRGRLPKAAVMTQKAVHELPHLGATLAPPAPSTDPPVSGSQAVGLALSQLGPTVRPTAITALLTLFNGQYLQWVVAFDGLCIPVYGPPEGADQRPDCGGHELNVQIDATTGAFIGAFSYR